ncbi:uncharacterized protein [Henckelia pumila]|uniref:uncharacterized protein n=1 Tax=Henckelia pumila TaxID=405737 RepID=UPI003C6DE8F5
MFALRVSSMAANGWRAVQPFGFLHSINVNDKLGCLTTIPLSAPFNSTAIRICHTAQAVKGDTDIFLGGMTDKDTIEDVKQIVEKVNRALSRREVCHTDFLTPTVLKESMSVLDNLVDIKMLAQGGYPEAERCRLSVGHPDILPSDPDVIAALNVSGNFGFGSYSHGDFLGSILGTGIVRDKVGDIILQGENGAHVLVVPELVDFLASSLNKVRNVSVTCVKIPLCDLQYEPPRTRSLKTVEASLRLDAVASAGFKISRSKMASLVSDGDVRVNWITVTKNNTTIKSGDMISVSGQGRLKIGEINSTRKGKFAVELIRYL